jgi:hypothetical protein
MARHLLQGTIHYCNVILKCLVLPLMDYYNIGTLILNNGIFMVSIIIKVLDHVSTTIIGFTPMLTSMLCCY